MFACGLQCIDCGNELDLGPYFSGCPKCSGALEVYYDEEAIRDVVSLEKWKQRASSVWRYRELLPLSVDWDPITLGEGGSPLVRAGEGLGNSIRELYLQNETVNPTFSFKDRFHSVSVSMACQLGIGKVVCSTTGNHGMSAAAYAARAGLDCVILVDPRTPTVQRDWMRLFGATVVVEMERKLPLQAFVMDHGWYPSTYMTPMPVSTPYGVEGYKTMAYDAVMALGKAPDHFVFPVAAGDGLYGPWKGYSELYRLGLTSSIPKVHGVQAAGANPIVRAIAEGLDSVPIHPNPETLALSIADATGGRMVLNAIRRSGGTAVEVSEDQIIAAMQYAARLGVSAEPSSAASIAGAWELERQGAISVGESVVCAITGAGPKWPDVVSRYVPGQELLGVEVPEFQDLMRGSRLSR